METAPLLLTGPETVQTPAPIIKKTPKPNPKYSWSRISLHEKCPWAYKTHYFDHVPRMGNDAADTGIVLHETIERYLNLLIAKGSRTEWSWASLALPLDACEDASELWTKFYGEFVYPEGTTDPGVEARLAFDKKWKPCKWEAKKARYRMVLDWHYRQGELGVVEDWKTGWAMPDNIEKDLQTRGYGWGIRQTAYPDASEILLRHRYIRFNRPPLEILLTASDLDTVPQEIDERIAIIERSKYFDPRPGNFCAWCGVQTHCPLVADALVPREIVAPASLDQAQEAVGVLLQLRNLEKLLSKRLREYVKVNGPLFEGDLVFGPQERASYSPDPRTTVDILLSELLMQADGDQGVMEHNKAIKEGVWSMLSATKTNIKNFLKKQKRLDLLDTILGTPKISTTIDFHKGDSA